MATIHTCTVREFPIRDVEYRVAPEERWETRPRPRSVRRRERRRTRLLVFLAGLLLFAGGFLLGRAEAAFRAEAVSQTGTAADPVPVQVLSPEEAAAVPEVDTCSPDQGALDPSDWRLMLVNWEHPLPEGFQVPELTKLKGGWSIDSRVYPALQSMMDGARAAGLQPVLCSAFRTRADQEWLFQNKIRRLLDAGCPRENVEAEAAMWVARPDTSEHQAGLAVDIADMSYQVLDEAQEKTPVQQWLMAHCAEYGFILRYPTDKSDLTGVGYEPWHYRYVGEEAARAIMDGGICLEEYLAG